MTGCEIYGMVRIILGVACLIFILFNAVLFIYFLVFAHSVSENNEFFSSVSENQNTDVSI